MKKGLKAVFKTFVQLCRVGQLLEGSQLSVDENFLRANTSKNRLLMESSLQKQLNEINQKYQSYLDELAQNDQPSEDGLAKSYSQEPPFERESSNIY